MFHRDTMPTMREPPGEAEMAYVRALVWPLEAKFAPVNPKPKRVFPPRVPKRMTDPQLLASYHTDPSCSVLTQLIKARNAA